MEKNYLTSIKSFLEDTVVLEPSPTDIEPRIYPNPGIRAFVFDIYGTLLISASGDIDEAELSETAVKSALQTAGVRVVPSASPHSGIYRNLLVEFRRAVKAFHSQERTEDMPFPEIDILEIWEKILLAHRSSGDLLFGDPLCIKCFTFVFEMLSNRIYPMPGMIEILMRLSQAGYPLGIVSNAQFYTPLILNYFLHNTISENEVVPPFDPDLTLFSYLHRRSKPDPTLFGVLAEQCAKKYGLIPGEIVYVGNDMFRDVYPASKAGMKTVLFAGDSKSLRLRKDRPEVTGIQPDFVITELMQLLTLINP